LIDCGCSAKYITENLGALGIVPKNLTATVITHVHTDHVRARQDLVFCVKITSLFISFPHEDAFEDAFRKYGQEIEECIIHTFVRKF
jgi:metal-dependent hydrolase (beta-lactamase superfamily II)